MALGVIGLEVCERLHGQDSPEVATVAVNLANAHGRLGDAATQRDLLQRALRIQEREYGPEHREVAITSFNLAQALWSSGEGAQARALMTRARASFVRAYGEGHPHARAAARACEVWG